jgi:hypothetical protein
MFRCSLPAITLGGKRRSQEMRAFAVPGWIFIEFSVSSRKRNLFGFGDLNYLN